MSLVKHEIEARGADIESAIQAGLEILRADRDEVVVEVLDEGSRGLLGIGRRDAVVRLTQMVDPAAPSSEAPVAEEPEDEPDVEPELEREVEPEPEPESPSAPEPVEQPVAEAVAEPTEPVVEPEPVVDTPVSAPVEEPEPEPAEPTAEEAAEIAELLSAEEVAIGIQHAEQLLTHAGLNATVSAEASEVDEVTGRRIPILIIDGADAPALIGTRGATLNALQFLLRQMTSQSIHNRTTFALDVAGYRERRQETLADLARRMADKAVKDGRSVTLNAMPPHERRIVHMTLRDDDRVETNSIGEGDRRRVRILTKSAGKGKPRRKRRRRRPRESRQ